MTRLSLTVNGVLHEDDVDDRLLLVDYLRETLGLTGTKVGCSMGACGACTVHLNGKPVLACLLFTVQASGRAVRTVEDLAPDGELHPLQKAFRAAHALQCGFCTPGMLMSVLDLVEAGEPLDEERAREAISGNLCRCTGYSTIVEAVVRAAAEARA